MHPCAINKKTEQSRLSSKSFCFSERAEWFGCQLSLEY